MNSLPAELSHLIEFQKFPLNGMVNQKLVDCLPGIFYLYELSESGAKIKIWNKNHEYVTGYTSEETKDKPPFFFVPECYYPEISGALESIRHTGYASKLYADILTKQGKRIPHVLEGYKFTVGAQTYFMGLGIDISELVSAKKRVDHLLTVKLDKEKELLTLSLQQQKNEKLLRTVLEELVALRSTGLDESNAHVIESLSSEIKSHFTLQNNWQNFKNLFNNIHLDFFNELKSRHPDLTQNELQYCAYVKIQMNPEQICDVLNISPEGLTKKRYRIRKKFGLERKQKLDKYILSF